VNASNIEPVKEMLKALGAKFKSIEISTDESYLEDARSDYKCDYGDSEDEGTPSFEEYLEEYGRYREYPDDKTIIVTLEDSTVIDLKHVFQDAFSIEADYC